MAEQSENLKKWLQQIEDITPEETRQERKELDDVLQLAYSFRAILVKIQSDFHFTKNGQTQFEVSMMDEDTFFGSGHGDVTINVTNPTNHANISDTRFNEIQNTLEDAADVAEYPNRVMRQIDLKIKGNVKREITPIITNGLLAPLHHLFESTINSVLKDKDLDLRDDYVGKEALEDFQKQIKEVQTKQNARSVF